MQYKPLTVHIKRVYDSPAAADGKRILVDRLWPRGLTKEKAQIDWWDKDIAPSPELRTWYGHEPSRWPEFQARYQSELVANQSAVEELRRQLETGAATLVYGAKEEQYSHARVLKEYLEGLRF